MTSVKKPTKIKKPRKLTTKGPRKLAEVDMFDERLIIPIDPETPHHVLWQGVVMGLLGYKRTGLGFKPTDTFSTKELALCLASGMQVPTAIAQHLAAMLDPPPKWRGPRLVIKSSKTRTNRRLLREQETRLRIRAEYKLGKDRGDKSDAVVAELSEKYNVSWTYVHEAIRLPDDFWFSALMSMQAKPVRK